MGIINLGRRKEKAAVVGSKEYITQKSEGNVQSLIKITFPSVSKGVVGSKFWQNYRVILGNNRNANFLKSNYFD